MEFILIILVHILLLPLESFRPVKVDIFVVMLNWVFLLIYSPFLGDSVLFFIIFI